MLLWLKESKLEVGVMKNILLAATMLSFATAVSSSAFAADMAAPAPVESPFSAVIDGWAGGLFFNGNNEFEPDGDSFFIFGGDARARLNLGDIVAIQGDLSADSTDDTSGDDRYEAGWQAGGHLSLYNDTGLIGVMGGIGEGHADNGTAENWLVGGEGQLYFDQTTLYLQAGYFDAEMNDDIEEDAFHNAYFVRGVGRYFLSPQTRLQAEASGAWGEQDEDDQNMYVYGWGLRADHQLTDMFSLFAAYDGAYYDNCCDGDDDSHFFEHQVRGGFSILLGRPDLLSVDRTGPTLDLPWARQWGAGGESID
jgi:hypothetical protein